MGDAGYSQLTDASQIFAAAVAAFPSPASPASSVLNTPLLERAPKIPSAPAVRQTPRDALFDAAAVPPVPDPIYSSEVQTPPARATPQPTLNMIVGGALAPTHEVPRPPRPISKPRPGLRLPSFDMLGIAVPHPDRFGIDSHAGQLPQSLQDITPESLSSPMADVDLPNAFESLKLDMSPPANTLGVPDKPYSPGRPLQSPHLFRDPLTPPDEVAFIDWNNAVLSQHTSVPNESHQIGTVLQGDSAQDDAVGGASAEGASQPVSQTIRSGPMMWYDDALCTKPDQFFTSLITRSS